MTRLQDIVPFGDSTLNVRLAGCNLRYEFIYSSTTLLSSIEAFELIF